MMDDKKNVTAFFLSTGVTVKKATSRFWRSPYTFLITIPLRPRKYDGFALGCDN